MTKCNISIILLFMFMFIGSCAAEDQRKESKSFEQTYVMEKIILGTFKDDKKNPKGTKDAYGINWMRMGRGNFAIDDSGIIYALSERKVILFAPDGKYNGEIILNGVSPSTVFNAIEVSSDGRKLFLTEKGRAGKFYLFNSEGQLFTTKDKDGAYLLTRSCKDIYFPRVYKGSNRADVNVLDKNLERIIGLKTFYLQNVKFDEKPLGFFDSEKNYYYMWYWPKVIKMTLDGKVAWEKSVSFKATAWSLIGIDDGLNLYATAIDAQNIERIIKLDRNLQTVTNFSLSELAKQLTAGRISDDHAEENFIVTCSGGIYFIPNYLKRNGYIIFKFVSK
jgi:hypothetical protein